MRATGLAVVLSILLLAARCAPPEDAFGPDQARALVPAAAEMDADLARVVKALGAAVTWEDLTAVDSTPLSVLLLAVGVLPYVDPSRDAVCADHFRSPSLGAAATPTDVLEGAGLASTNDTVSLLRADFLREVTCERKGDEAHGTVSFECKAPPRGGGAPAVLYEGRVEWGARGTSSGWRIDEFRLPGCGLRVVRADGAWRAERIGLPGVPFRPPSPEAREVPGSELVRVGGERPAKPTATAWTMAIRAEGRVWVKGDVPDIGELDNRGSYLAHWGAGGRGTVVLRVHAHAPWSLVGHAFRRFARLPAGNLFLAVRGAEGDEEGVVPCILAAQVPTFRRGGGAPPAAPAGLLVRIDAHAAAVDLEKIVAVAARRFAEKPDADFSIAVADGVEAGHVIRVLDALRRAGAEHVTLVATADPRPDPKTPLGQFVKDHPVTAPGFSITIGGEAVGG